MADKASEGSGSKTLVEWKIVEVKKFELIRSYTTDHGDGRQDGGSERVGLYDTIEMAERVKDVIAD